MNCSTFEPLLHTFTAVDAGGPPGSARNSSGSAVIVKPFFCSRGGRADVAATGLRGVRVRARGRRRRRRGALARLSATRTRTDRHARPTTGRGPSRSRGRRIVRWSGTRPTQVRPAVRVLTEVGAVRIGVAALRTCRHRLTPLLHPPTAWPPDQRTYSPHGDSWYTAGTQTVELISSVCLLTRGWTTGVVTQIATSLIVAPSRAGLWRRR